MAEQFPINNGRLLSIKLETPWMGVDQEALLIPFGHSCFPMLALRF